jgi:hypothetical protein
MIDLTLTINFIPAVICLCKSALMSLLLSILDPDMGGFLVFATLLNLDRAITCRIFDENGVQCLILASWVINFLRLSVVAPYLVNPIITLLWVVYTFILVLEPKRLLDAFMSDYMFLVPGILTSLFVVAMAFTPLEIESEILKSSRVMCFSTLCVAWVYVVSVWKPKPINTVFECHLLLSRFCPVLFIKWGVAMVYTFGCACVLFYYFYKNNVNRSNIDKDIDIIIKPNIAEEEDFDAYFKAACQSKLV